jgi:hypothetical protein
MEEVEEAGEEEIISLMEEVCGAVLEGGEEEIISLTEEVEEAGRSRRRYSP